MNDDRTKLDDRRRDRTALVAELTDAGARFTISADDPLCTFLRVPPSGDMRTAFYHLQEGARLPFTHEFQDRFGEDRKSVV